MKRWSCCLFIFCIILGCHGLSCRTEDGYKDAAIKKIYNTCLKQQGSNVSNGHQTDDRRDGEPNWNNEYKSGYRDERSDIRGGNRDRNRDENDERNGMGNRSSRGQGYDANGGYKNMNSRSRNDDNGYGRAGQTNGQKDRLNGRDDFIQSDEYDGDRLRSNYYNQYNRRMKRERRVEVNSGKRSQYNPNSHKTEDSDNSSESRNSSRTEDKACALHCLMEKLQMTGDNGMPDRYLVTHTIIKDVKNADLLDFLQESIEECFQILDNENIEDKCEFAKNILLCLSEKGRANCDDWKDDFQF